MVDLVDNEDTIKYGQSTNRIIIERLNEIDKKLDKILEKLDQK